MDEQMYHIRVAGHGGPMWSEWFAQFTLTNLDNGEAILSGVLPDQAALHGVLGRLRDLGIPLLEVRRDAPAGRDRDREGAAPAAPTLGG